MTAPDTEFQLDSAVVVFPASELSERDRATSSCTDGDVVITNPRVRSGSIVTQQRTADVLESFRRPRTIVDGVLHYSRVRRLDAMEVFEAVYPALEEFVRNGFLIEAGGEAGLGGAAALLDFGDDVEIVRCVHELPDVSVFHGRLGSRNVAIKVGSAGDPFAEASIANEGRLLASSTSRVTPELVRSGRSGSQPFIIMEWLSGVLCTTVAREARVRSGHADRRRLLRLAESIVEAYADLHDSGLLHGDVHPGNTLVDRAGVVRLIDFGLGRRTDERADVYPVPGRGGTGFYYEPELAAAKIAGLPLPEITPRGELFSVAAIAYLVLAGRHYKSLPLDENMLYEAVAQGGMCSFEEAGAPPWPEVERLLEQALSTEPLDRPASTRELAAGLASVRLTDRPRRSRRAVSPGADALASDIVSELTKQPSLPAAAPTSSINFGAGGSAYFLLRLACLTDEPEYLVAADLWLRAALADESSDAFFCEALDVTPTTVGHGSVFHGVVGLHALDALVAQAMGNLFGVTSATRAFVEAARTLPCHGSDLTLGRAGQLNLAAILASEATMSTGSADAQLLAFGGEIHDELDTLLRRPTSIALDLDVSYLGIAHGWAGILFASLSWCAATSQEVPDVVHDRLVELFGLGEPIGRGMRWPIRNKTVRHVVDATSFMSGWCNGSAGLVHLFLLAREQTGHDMFGDAADLAAWNAWESADRSNFSLCCGTAGRAYALLAMHRRDGETEWLERSIALAEDAASAARGERSLWGSLYKGALGPALLATEIADPSFAAMPFLDC